jgi:hypothetical protein
MPKRLSSSQMEWFKYKQLRELSDHFEVRWQDPNDGWGPFPKEGAVWIPREFFNVLWDFGVDLKDQEYIDLNEGTLSLIAQRMEMFSSKEYNEKDYEDTLNNLRTGATQLGF